MSDRTPLDRATEFLAADAADKGRQAEVDALGDRVVDALRTVYDPEIPVNIVDLGLVYKCETEPLDGGERVKVEFTLTAPGCGMGDFLRQDVQQKLLALPGVKDAEVQVVLDPPWDQSMMSDAARLQLGLM